jgi:hypothetical protein
VSASTSAAPRSPSSTFSHSGERGSDNLHSIGLPAGRVSIRRRPRALLFGALTIEVWRFDPASSMAHWRIPLIQCPASAHEAREATDGSMLDITVELPKLLDRRDRAVAVFTGRGITDLFGQFQECVDLLADLTIRAEFINKLRMFYETLNIVEHRPEVRFSRFALIEDFVVRARKAEGYPMLKVPPQVISKQIVA